MKEITLMLPGGHDFQPVVADVPGGGISQANTIIQWATTMLMIVSVLIATFFLIWGGIQWISSSGDKTKIEESRKKILYAVIGLIVVFGSFLIVTLVSQIFGIDFFG